MWAEEADESWFGDLPSEDSDNAAPIIGEMTVNAIAEAQTILPGNALIEQTNDLKATEQQMIPPATALIEYTNEEQLLRQFLAEHGIDTQTIQMNNQSSASNDLNNAAAAAMATKVFQSLEELKKRDAIVHELEKQLHDAMQIIQQQVETTPHRNKFPSVRRHKMKKRKAVPKTPLAGSVSRGRCRAKCMYCLPNRKNQTTTVVLPHSDTNS